LGQPGDADLNGMRVLAIVSVLSALVLGSASNGLAVANKPPRVHRSGHVHAAQTVLQRATSLLFSAAQRRINAARPAGTAVPKSRLSSLELDIVARINAQRGARALRPLRVSRGLTAAADYHSHQMGRFGFFEHQSRNGAPFWRRIERFYPSGRGYWSVGENIFWESPDTTASSAVHEWMMSPPHRADILTREWRDVGVAAVHYDAAPGVYGGGPVTIVTADFGVRR
jgi:uncharacterized protein YkwD